ncbi:MAG: DUF255 domain-containing protein [Bacteroidetes bacterium]|nr:DUF255 domain-containing protein [Bacteroidota bacterium]
MKKIFFSIAMSGLLIIGGSFTKPAEELQWLGFTEGYAKAKKLKKIALIDTYTEWCGWCKKMDRDTYTNSAIISKVNKEFVPIKFNPEIKDVKYTLDGKEYTGFELLSVISNKQQSGYPTTFFITKKNRVMIEVGYQDATQFSATLDKIIAENNN